MEGKVKNTKGKATVRESTIEAYLRQRTKALGGRADKWVSPGNVGVPDRIVIMPGGVIGFVELKAPGRKSTPMQRLQQERLRALGCRVYADVDSREKVDALLAELQGGAA